MIRSGLPSEPINKCTFHRILRFERVLDIIKDMIFNKYTFH